MRHVFTAVVMVLFIALSVGYAGEHAYVGLKKCSMCHKGEKKGKIFETWQGTKHAEAYTTLAGEEAKKTYEALGKTGNPQEDPDCLRCHVTGYGADSTLIAKIIPENGITCESCHGPGGDYAKMSVMKDRAASVAAGLADDPKKACIKCHNSDSPSYKEFNFDTFWKQIAHGLPAKAE